MTHYESSLVEQKSSEWLYSYLPFEDLYRNGKLTQLGRAVKHKYELEHQNKEIVPIQVVQIVPSENQISILDFIQNKLQVTQAKALEIAQLFHLEKKDYFRLGAAALLGLAIWGYNQLNKISLNSEVEAKGHSTSTVDVRDHKGTPDGCHTDGTNCTGQGEHGEGDPKCITNSTGAKNGEVDLCTPKPEKPPTPKSTPKPKDTPESTRISPPTKTKSPDQTPCPPSKTPVPRHTDTAIPPTPIRATSTSFPSTETSLPPTSTNIPDTATPHPETTPTSTRIPETPTKTPVATATLPGTGGADTPTPAVFFVTPPKEAIVPLAGCDIKNPLIVEHASGSGMDIFKVGNQDVAVFQTEPGKNPNLMTILFTGKGPEDQKGQSNPTLNPKDPCEMAAEVTDPNPNIKKQINVYGLNETLLYSVKLPNDAGHPEFGPNGELLFVDLVTKKILETTDKGQTKTDTGLHGLYPSATIGPDGREYLAYVNSGKIDIAVKNPQTGKYELFASTGISGTRPKWTKDGNILSRTGIDTVSEIPVFNKNSTTWSMTNKEQTLATFIVNPISGEQMVAIGFHGVNLYDSASQLLYGQGETLSEAQGFNGDWVATQP